MYLTCRVREFEFRVSVEHEFEWSEQCGSVRCTPVCAEKSCSFLSPSSLLQTFSAKCFL